MAGLQLPPTWIVGIQVKVKVLTGEEITGTVFTYDATSGMVVLDILEPAAARPSPRCAMAAALALTPAGSAQEYLANDKRNIRMLKSSFIKEVQYVAPPNQTVDTSRLPPLNIGRIREREAAAIRKAYEAASRIGIGVPPEAQQLFDALSKTMPVEWEAEVIVVFREVRICPPYAVESVTGGSQLSRDRVKKVVELEWRRMLRKTPAAGAAGASPSPPGASPVPTPAS
eukprot:tig00021434_g21368.t1